MQTGSIEGKARIQRCMAFAIAALMLASPNADANFVAADPFGTEAAVRKRECTAAVAPERLSLTEAVDLALCNHPQTRQAWAAVRMQAAQAGVAQSAFLPSLDASLGASRNWTDAGSGASSSSYTRRGAGAALSYLLVDFGARRAGLESARHMLAAAAAAQDSTIQTVMLAAIQSFFQVQQGGAALDAALQSERSSLESLKAAQARYLAGAATPADRLQAQTAYSQATLVRVQAEGKLKIAQGTLAVALGLDANAALALAESPQQAPPDSFARDVAALIEQARQRRPDLAAAQAQWNAARAGIDAARAAGLPSIALSVSASRSHESGAPAVQSGSIGISVSIPLFSGYATTYRVRAAQAQADASEAQFSRLRLQVALDVWQAYQSVLTALQSLRTTEDLLASAHASQQVALGRYRNGVGTIVDLLTAESALANARQQRVQSLFDWNVSRAVLAQAMGTLDAGLLQPGSGAATTGKARP